jgi:hypothetical protein
LLERECCSGNITPSSKRFQMKTRWRPPDYQTPRVVNKGRPWEYYAHFKAISNEHKMAATWLSDSTCCEKETAVLGILRPLQNDLKRKWRPSDYQSPCLVRKKRLSWEHYAHLKLILNENKMETTRLSDSTCFEQRMLLWQCYTPIT